MADSKTCDNCGQTALATDTGQWITTRGGFTLVGRSKNSGDFCSPACVSDYFARLAGLPERGGAQTRRLGFLGRVRSEPEP